MARALSLYLRERVIAAIEAGASCRQAAEGFGVGKASAIRWHARYRAEGEIAAKPMGGDRHSHRSEAHAALILQAYQARPQVYLREVQEALREHGATTVNSDLAVVPNSVVANSRLVNHSLPTPVRRASVEIRVDPRAMPERCRTALQAAVQACRLPPA